MKHFNDNKRGLARKTYWKSDDPNIIIEISSVSSEIHVDKLLSEIAGLESQINFINAENVNLSPEMITALREKVLECTDESTFEKLQNKVNSTNTFADVELLKNQLSEKKTLLEELIANGYSI